MAVRTCLLPLGLIAACAAAAPAHAQSDALADLDVLADASGDAATGIRLARDQIGESDLTGAAATLERVLMADPGSNEALLLHASLLCRLDDREGAALEIGALRGAAADSPGWADVTAACGAMRRGNGGN